MSRLIDLSGKTFGRLLIVEREGRERGYATWKCKCECGAIKIARSSCLIDGSLLSCGCYGRERQLESVSTHKMSKTKVFRIWVGMKSRCADLNNPLYPRYGGRGIRVCPQWLNSFEAFLKDMGEPPEGMSLDRYPNNDGDYEPGNCRWATSRQQANNRSSSVRHEYKGQFLTLREISDLTGVNCKLLKSRVLTLKWSIEKAIFTPPREFK